MTRIDTWKEIAYVSITKQNASPYTYHFCALSESIDIDEGERGIETVKTLCGGRIVRSLPQEDTTITMKLYPQQAGVVPGGTTDSAARGIHDLFYESVSTSSATTGEIVVNNASSGSRNKYRIAVLWTDLAIADGDATGEVDSPANAGLRWVGRNGYITKIAQTFSSDGQLAYDVTFVVPARQANGTTANIQVESVDGVATGTMTALVAYTADDSGF